MTPIPIREHITYVVGNWLAYTTRFVGAKLWSLSQKWWDRRYWGHAIGFAKEVPDAPSCVHRDQAYLLPPALDDWVRADHPVRFVAAFVDGLTSADWAQLGVASRGAWTGAPAYHPEVLLSVWLAGFMSGVRSVRALEAACRDQLSFRWLTGNQVPDHNTLWRFYAVHRTQLPQLFQLTVKTAWKAGLVDLALLAVDGTKVAGNVARAGMQDAEALVALQMQVAARTAELVAQVEAEGATAAPRLPPELRQTRALQDRVTAARQAVTAEDGPTRANPVDADARLLPTRQGWIAGYNAQAAVVATPATVADEPGGRIIVAVDVVTAEHDAGQLLPVRDAAVATLGQAPETLLADGGYHRGPDLVGCAARGQVVVMPEAQGDRLQDPTHKDQFAYDPETDRYTCRRGSRCAARERFTGRTGRRCSATSWLNHGCVGRVRSLGRAHRITGMAGHWRSVRRIRRYAPIAAGWRRLKRRRCDENGRR